MSLLVSPEFLREQNFTGQKDTFSLPPPKSLLRRGLEQVTMETGKLNSGGARPLQRLISPHDGGGWGQNEKLMLRFPLWLWPEGKEQITVGK